MSERTITEIQDGVLRLTLNRPDKRNAIDAAMVTSLLSAMEEAELTAEVRAVVISGAGKDFCAGADLSELLASVQNTPDQNEQNAASLGAVFVRIRELPKPVIAAVHGRALAGGCGLATACDMVVAQEGASFGYPEIKRGFVPAMVMAMLRRAVGEKTAFDLVATGRVLSAKEALAIGLINRVYLATQFDAKMSELTNQLGAGSPSAIALIKQQLYALDGRSFRDGIALGAKVNAVARSSPDFERAVSSFFEKD